MSRNEHHASFDRITALLTAAISNARLYTADHPQVVRYLDAAYQALCVQLTVHPEITLLVIGNDLVVNDQTIDSQGRQHAQLVGLLRRNGIGRVSFAAGLQAVDLTAFVQELSSEESRAIHSRPGIQLGQVEVRSSEASDAGPPFASGAEDQELLETIASLASLRDIKLEELKALYHQTRRYEKIDLGSIDDMIKKFIGGFSRGINPLRLLADIKSADEYTFTHVVNVCLLTMGQAEALGFTGRHLYDIGIASVLHDVGKQFIPDEILNKPGQLTPEERKIIETHTIKGAQYLLGLEEIPKLAVLGALEHHIRFDGSGYPAIAGDWEPNIASQMLAVADMFDAMRSRRPYQEPKPQELILKIMREEAGTCFNPLLVDNFIRLITRTNPLAQAA
ncbi:MAG: HD domain-containing protein [Desulfosarcinaceae bacterium]|nr:HD domain-containing protein [Desulfosarcinaceae bacterium]